jgi:hypothetical protein
MPEAAELLHGNLFQVFGERDPGLRRAAIGRTYTDVTFTDPDGKPVARGVDMLTIRDGHVSHVRTLIARQSET